MPRATFTHQAVAAATPGRVWVKLQEAETWANIGPVEEVSRPETDAEGNLESFAWSTTVAARRYPGTARVVVAEPQQRMVLDLDTREVVGSLSTVLTPNGKNTTVVTVTLEVTARGPMSTVFFPLVTQAIARGLPTQVDDFAASLG
jgi:hypothetical protein